MTERLPTKIRHLLPAVGLGLAVAVSNGFARFAYALLLPAMREDLLWNYAQSGWLNTANALGYVVGAISGYLLLRRVSATRLFAVGLWICFLCLGATGLGTSIAWLSTTRALAGIGAAWVFSCGGALIQQRYLAQPELRGIATGIYFGGAGMGIVASGLAINPFLAAFGAGAWPQAWQLLGLLGAVCALWPLLIVRGMARSPQSALPPAREALPLRRVLPALSAYFLYACGYIVYMTFIVAWMREHRFAWPESTLVWALLGGAIALSPFVWRRALETWAPTHTFAASCFLTLIGTGILLLGNSLVFLLLSAGIYGLGLFIVPAAVSVLARQELGLALLPRAMALFTSVFAIGQTLGPVAAGSLADHYSLSASLWMSLSLLALATGLSLLRPPQEKSA